VKADAPQIYLLHRYRKQQVAWQTINGDYSALRLFYKHILGREWNLKKLPRPRKQKSLPKVISPEQVSLLIEKAVTFKHKVFITLLYSTGLRLGEALNLRVEDIEASAMRIRVNDGKGNKDRYTLLSLDLLDMLRFYFRAFRPEGGWVFNGKYRGEKWSQKGAQHAIVEARKRAKLPDFVTAHVLRHCFATHLLQNGTDLVAIQQLMGHKYLKTTAQYIHLDNQHFTKITNPSDRIEAWEKLTQSVLQKGINSEKFSANSATVLSKNIAPPVSYVEPLKTSKNAEPKPSVD
jgi:site-specific recombinase XerD